MKLNTAEPNLRADSNISDASQDHASEMDLYGDLLTFSSLSPQEQNAAAVRPGAGNIIDLPTKSTIEISQQSAACEQQKTSEPAEASITPMSGQPPPQANAEPISNPTEPGVDLAAEIAFEMEQESANQMLQETSRVQEMDRVQEIEEVQEIPSEPAREPASEPQRVNAFDKNDSADFQLAEILRVTGSLANFPTKQAVASALLACAECGSLNESEDVFCITCGGLLEEAERAPLFSCDDCGSEVSVDEIFCPSCGSVMPDA